MHLMIGVLLVVSWLLCRKMPKGKDNLFGSVIVPFYQISEGIFRLILKKVLKSEYVERLTEKLKVLYPNKEEKNLIRQYICYKISLMLTIIAAATLVSFAVIQGEKEQNSVTEIEREDYWGYEKEELLKVKTEGMQEQELAITVTERKYDNRQLSKVFKKTAQSLEQLILGENESLDCVTTNLNLVSEIPETQIKVQWEMVPDCYMEPGGVLIPGTVTEAGAVVQLTAHLSYGEEEFHHSFAVHLQQPHLTEEEQWKERVKQEITLLNVSSVAAEVLELPKEIDGRQVFFGYPKETYGYKLFIAFIICAFLVFFMKDESLQKEMELRKKQMLLDYSEIVSKLTLLLGAGMTIRASLEKIAYDYNQKRQQSQIGQRFAYDEILYVCREMQGGISERNAIDILGRRCQIPCYMKLCSLLLQNLKKGSKGMAESLSYEVGQAFEERKNHARRLGEEAGTKLLVPMILMLIIVMAILIIPAFLSF